MVKRTVDTVGRLDAAFYNAGIQSPAVKTADVDGEVFDQFNSINLRGVWSFMKYELLQMRKKIRGSIEQLLFWGDRWVPGRAAYQAGKHGVLGLTKVPDLSMPLEDSRQRGLPRDRGHTNGLWHVGGSHQQCFGYAVRARASSLVMRWRLMAATRHVDDSAEAKTVPHPKGLRL